MKPATTLRAIAIFQLGIMVVNVALAIARPAWWSIASAIICLCLALYSFRLAALIPRLTAHAAPRPPAPDGCCGSCGHPKLRTETARQLEPCRCPCHVGADVAKVEAYWRGTRP